MSNASRDVHDSLLCLPDSYVNHNAGLARSDDRPIPVPDRLLPGRLLMAMAPGRRAELAKADFSNVAPWWIKVMCS